MKQPICFVSVFIFLNKPSLAKSEFSTNTSSIFLSYIVALFAVILGVIVIVIYFCLVRTRADSSQDISKRSHFNFKRKPTSANSTGSLNSNESHQKSNSPSVPLTQPKNNDKNIEKETAQETLARLEYESRVFKLRLMRVD